MKQFSILVSFIFLLSGGAVAQEINILSKTYPLERIEQIVAERSDFGLYPKISERARWNEIPAATKEALVKRGEAALSYTYQGVPASQLINDMRAGEYGPSANLQFEARRKLNDLVLAEAVEDKGRFLPAIIDIIWRICEESSWPTLSHYYLHKEGDAAKLELALPDVTDPIVDLWAAETAKNLSWIVHILDERFDAVTPRINVRISHEINRRVLAPAMERDDFWWMGFSGGNRGIVNNWNPWISSNWLPTVLLIEDKAERAAALHKILRVVDQFINHYAEDGGIDEGPTYWDRAGGSLFDILALLHAWSDGEIDVFDHPKVRNIIAYIYRAHIDGRYVVNFTDAPPTFKPRVTALYHMGVLFGDDRLKQFAQSFWAEQEGGLSGVINTQIQGGRDLDRIMFSLFYLDENAKGSGASAPYERDVWFTGIQQMIARSKDGTPEGFFLAAKGGHNNESHNHNDVGSFIIYHNGLPAIIDVGPQSYTLKTFGAGRYSMWHTQSAYHTAPTINGVMQTAGVDFAARDVTYHTDEASATLSMDIAKAYPVDAGVDTWQRTVTLVRDQGVLLRDAYSLEQVTGKTSLNFVTPRPVSVQDYGALLEMPDGAHIRMHFDRQRTDIRIEKVTFDDRIMKRNWGQDVLYRIVLEPKSQPKAQTLDVKFTR